MKIHFISYGNQNYVKSRERLRKEAIKSHFFDTVTIYTHEDIDNEFKTRYEDILSQRHGGGYWLWKYYILQKKFEEVDDGDIVIYADAGCTINSNGKNRFNEYIKMFDETVNPNKYGIISFQMNLPERDYTVKQLFDYFSYDIEHQYALDGQYVGGILICKKNEHCKNLLKEYIRIIDDDNQLITNYYKQFPQHYCFIDHRHDQSILSLLRKIHGSIVVPDETYFQPFGSKYSLQFPFWATRIRG